MYFVFDLIQLAAILDFTHTGYAYLDFTHTGGL